MTKQFRAVILIVTVLCIPRLVRAEVYVSEVAWMGTAENSANEWIELGNNGSSAISLSGYTLEWAVGSASPKIVALAGSIPGNGYFLLERTDDTTLLSVNADQIYVGSLSNLGERIEIKKGGVTVSSVDQTGGWIAGNNDTKETMQLSGSSWITAVGTPKQASAQNSGTQSLSTNQSVGEVTTTGSGGTVVSTPQIDTSLSATLEKPRFINTGLPALFRVALSPVARERDSDITWSFGDGGVGRGLVVSHTYTYSGSYPMAVRVSKGDKTVLLRSNILVTPAEMRIVGYASGLDGYIEIENAGDSDIDMTRFQLASGMKTYYFPQDFLLSAGTKVKIINSESRIDFWQEPISLYDSSMKLRASYSTPIPAVLGTSTTKEAVKAVVSRAVSRVSEDVVLRVKENIPLTLSSTSTGSSTEVLIKIERNSSLVGKVIGLPKHLLIAIWQFFMG